MTRALKLTAYMSVQELAERLNCPADSASIRRLKRRIRAKERAIGQPILLHLDGRKNGPVFTTEKLIRHHMPELVSTRDEMAEAFRQIVDDINEKIEEQARRSRAIAASIRQILPKLEALQKERPRAANGDQGSG